MATLHYEKMSNFLDRSRKDITEGEFKDRLMAVYKDINEETRDRMYAASKKLGGTGSFYQVLFVFDTLYMLGLEECNGES
jgi:hypothetical protein